MNKSEQLKGTILEVATELFLVNGYDQTTITEIINKVGGLSRGGFYHHFSSKEAVLAEIPVYYRKGDQHYHHILADEGLTGLEKMRQLVLYNFNQIVENDDERKLVALLTDPRFLELRIKSIRSNVFELYESLIIEGNQDGSLCVEHPKMVAQMSAVLLNLWCQPTIFDCSPDELRQRYDMVKSQLEALSIPLFNEEVWLSCERYLQQLDC